MGPGPQARGAVFGDLLGEGAHPAQNAGGRRRTMRTPALPRGGLASRGILPGPERKDRPDHSATGPVKNDLRVPTNVVGRKARAPVELEGEELVLDTQEPSPRDGEKTAKGQVPRRTGGQGETEYVLSKVLRPRRRNPVLDGPPEDGLLDVPRNRIRDIEDAFAEPQMLPILPESVTVPKQGGESPERRNGEREVWLGRKSRVHKSGPKVESRPIGLPRASDGTHVLTKTMFL